MVSSANCNKDTLVLSLPTKKPSVIPVSSALIINLLRTSATRVKRKGERGSPYLNPLEALTQPFAFPLTKIAKLEEDKQPLIHDLHPLAMAFLHITKS